MKKSYTLFKIDAFNFSILLVGVLCLFVLSCTDEKIPVIPSDCDPSIKVVYNGEVEALLEKKCATVGCHDGTEQSIYFNYQGASNSIDNGEFESFVLLREGTPMPPEDEELLTAVELKLLTCWKENNFAEK